MVSQVLSAEIFNSLLDAVTAGLALGTADLWWSLLSPLCHATTRGTHLEPKLASALNCGFSIHLQCRGGAWVKLGPCSWHLIFRGNQAGLVGRDVWAFQASVLLPGWLWPALNQGAVAARSQALEMLEEGDDQPLWGTAKTFLTSILSLSNSNLQLLCLPVRSCTTDGTWLHLLLIALHRSVAMLRSLLGFFFSKFPPPH